MPTRRLPRVSRSMHTHDTADIVPFVISPENVPWDKIPASGITIGNDVKIYRDVDGNCRIQTQVDKGVIVEQNLWSKSLAVDGVLASTLGEVDLGQDIKLYRSTDPYVHLVIQTPVDTGVVVEQNLNIGKSLSVTENLGVTGYGDLGSLRIGGVEVIDGNVNVKNVKGITLVDPSGSGNYVTLKVIMMPDMTNPNIYNPILRIDQGLAMLKDSMSAGGFLGSQSRTVMRLQSSGYVPCVESDLGKFVEAYINGAWTYIGALVYYDNSQRVWWTSESRSFASGTQLRVKNGTGAGYLDTILQNTGGGAILIGHGFTSYNDMPRIVLTDSTLGFDTLEILDFNNNPAKIRLNEVILGSGETHKIYRGADDTIRVQTPTDKGLIVEQNLWCRSLAVDEIASVGGDLLVGGYGSFAGGLAVISTGGDVIANSFKGTSSIGAVKAGDEFTIAWDENCVYLNSHYKHLILGTPSGKDVRVQRALYVYDWLTVEEQINSLLSYQIGGVEFINAATKKLLPSCGGLGKTLTPNWVDGYILVYRSNSDSWVMEPNPASQIPWTSVPSDIIPDGNLTRSLGSSSKAWLKIYAGYGYIGDLSFTNRLLCGLLTSDPTLSEGVIWYRSDVDKLYIYTTAKKQIFPADWSDITNKPSTFPPSVHTHYRSEVLDFWSSPFWGNIPDKPSTFPPSAHTHSASDITSGVLSLDRIPTIPYTKTDFANQNLFTTSDTIFRSVKAQGDAGVAAVKCGDSTTSYIDLTFDSSQAYITAHYRHLTLARDADKEVTINPLTDSSASEYGLSISASVWTDLLSVSRTLSVGKKALIIAEAYIYTTSCDVGYMWECRILVDGSQPTGAYQRQSITGYFTHVSVSAIVSLSAGSHTITLQGWSSVAGTVYHRRLDVLYL